MAATDAPARARASRPAAPRPWSKNACDAVHRREHDPAVVGERRDRERDRLDGDRRQLDDGGAERLEPAAQLAGLLPRPRDHDGASEQRPVLEPAEVEGGDVADDDRRRRLHTGVGDGGERGAHGPLVGAGAVAHRGDRGAGVAAGGDQPVGELADAARAHEDHEGAAGAGERVPVDVDRALGRVLVPGDDGEVRRHAPVGDRDPGVGGRADGAGDAGHDLERDAGGGERLGLLAAPAEHERVAALQTHDGAAAPAVLDEQRVDRRPGRSRPRPGPCPRRCARPRAARARAAPGRRAGRRRRRRPAASSSAPRTVSSPGSPGPAPTRWTVTPRPRPSPRARARRGRRARRAGGGPPRRPRASGSSPSTSHPQHDVPVERRQQHLERDGRVGTGGRRERAAREVAAAAEGAEVGTLGGHRPVHRRRRRSPRAGRGCRRSSARHSTAIAPCATCGSISDGSSRSAMRSAAPSRSRAVAATTIASNCDGLLEAGRDVAPQLAEPEVGPQPGELGPPAHRARCRPGRRSGGRRACSRRARRGDRHARAGRRARGPRASPAGRSLAECTATSARPFEDVLLHLLHEHAGAAHRVDRHVALLVAAGRDTITSSASPPRRSATRVAWKRASALPRVATRRGRTGLALVGRALDEAEHLVEVEELRQRVGVQLPAYRPGGALHAHRRIVQELVDEPAGDGLDGGAGSGVEPGEPGAVTLELRLPQLLGALGAAPRSAARPPAPTAPRGSGRAPR